MRTQFVWILSFVLFWTLGCGGLPQIQIVMPEGTPVAAAPGVRRAAKPAPSRQPAEIQVTTMAAVQVIVDGVPAPFDSQQGFVASVAPGAHRVEVINLVGRQVGAADVSVNAGERARFQYRKKTLSALSTVVASTPAPAPAPVAAAAPPPRAAAAPVQQVQPTQQVVSASAGGVTTSVSIGPGGIEMRVPTMQEMQGQAQQYQQIAAAPAPAPAAPAAMSAGSFSSLRSSVASASFSDDKLDLVRSAAARNYFSCAQVGSLVDTFAHSSDKVDAVRILRHRVVDPQNAHTLSAHFSFSDDKSTVQQMFM